MMIRNVSSNQFQQIVIRTAPLTNTSVNNFMKQKWQHLFPNLSYEPQFIENRILDTVDTNDNVIIIFGFIGFFAGLMSFTGLFTLVSLTIIRKVKEIGIRKILGASIVDIVNEISFQFILILTIASIIGGLIGYSMVDISMDAAWEYYKKVNIGTICISIAVMLLLAVLIVGFKIINAARINTVENLRTE